MLMPDLPVTLYFVKSWETFYGSAALGLLVCTTVLVSMTEAWATPEWLNGPGDQAAAAAAVWATLGSH